MSDIVVFVGLLLFSKRVKPLCDGLLYDFNPLLFLRGCLSVRFVWDFVRFIRPSVRLGSDFVRFECRIVPGCVFRRPLFAFHSRSPQSGDRRNPNCCIFDVTSCLLLYIINHTFQHKCFYIYIFLLKQYGDTEFLSGQHRCRNDPSLLRRSRSEVRILSASLPKQAKCPKLSKKCPTHKIN